MQLVVDVDVIGLVSVCVEVWMLRYALCLWCIRQLVWSFDLEGIAEMYLSYEVTNLWPLLANTPQGVQVDFVKAANSNFRWAGSDEDLIRAYGHEVHVLPDAGHWVHTDNPNGLFSIMAANSPALGGNAAVAERSLQGTTAFK